jgi:hypothetical protein
LKESNMEKGRFTEEQVVAILPRPIGRRRRSGM